jgi:DNA-binding NarL/FixJ family response regulator
MTAAFVDDLLFRSKIRAAASHTGAAVSFLRDARDPALAAARVAIVDLDGPDAVGVVSALRTAWPDLRVVGFVSHVHADRIRDARQAGATEVMARSAFVNALPDLLRADS